MRSRNATVCSVLEIILRYKCNATRPTFSQFLIYIYMYMLHFLPAFRALSSTIRHLLTSWFWFFPRNCLTHRNIGAGVCSSRLGLQSWGMVAFTPVKIILGEIWNLLCTHVQQEIQKDEGLFSQLSWAFVMTDECMCTDICYLYRVCDKLTTMPISFCHLTEWSGGVLQVTLLPTVKLAK